jgi:predicted RNA-binding protein with PUA-like domain
MNHWLLKTEPEVYSLEDLKKEPNQTTCWDSIRNYAARLHLRNMQVGDEAFFYYSQVNPPAIVGIVKIVRTAYPDHTQFDPASPYFDPKSSPADPRWDMVDVQFQRDIHPPITLPEIKQTPGLENMALLRIGRLSVQPVTANEWKIILSLRS